MGFRRVYNQGGGGVGTYNRTKKCFENKLHGSADQNTFWIWSLFSVSKRRKKSNSFRYKLKGGLYPDAFFLRVDGPINEGGGVL